MDAATTAAERAASAGVDPAYTLAVDLFLLLLCAGVIAASTILTPGPEGVSLFGVEFPSTCLFRNLTGMRCLGCGLTRSFTYMGHADLPSAFRQHVVGPVFWLFVAAQVPYRAIRVGRAVRVWRARP